MPVAPTSPEFGKFARIPWCSPDLRLTPEASRELDLLMTGSARRALVAGLRPAAAVGAGARHFVTDSTVAAAGNFGAAVAGGGGHAVPVYSDGSTWRIG